MRFKWVIIPAAILMVVASCQENRQSKKATQPQSLSALSIVDLQSYAQANPQAKLSPDDWKKMKWVAKTLRVLRGNQGLNPGEPIQGYLKKSKGEIVDELLDAPRFGDTLLLFNLFYTGFFQTNIRNAEGEWNEFIFSHQGPLLSAIQASKGNDYFSLFDFHSETILQPLNEPVGSFPEGTPVDERRELAFEELVKGILKVRDWVENQMVIQKTDFCSKYEGRMFGWTLDRVGFKPDPFFTAKFVSKVRDHCRNSQIDPAPPIVDKQALLKDIDQQIQKLNTLMTHVRNLYDYKDPKELQDFRSIDLQKIEPLYQNRYFSFEQAVEISNSSTNFNRRRAAYILDRFLCDNLIPIDVELPQQHSSDQHGNDPSCYACHYRLDPMAGFFRDYGFFFDNFANKSTIMFDDLATADKKEYDKNWMNPEGHPRQWNVGIIRSEKDESKNFYGETIEDLFNYLKTIPEVKKCLTRRVFEYVTSQGQNVDGKYLDDTANEFIRISQGDSLDGIKYLFKTFVLSNTFLHPDPVITQCYDFPGNVKPKNVPPCEVRFIIEKHCSKCHYPFGGEADLDMTSWLALPDGQFGFVHTPNGTQLKPEETFKLIKERLSSTDPKKRMPLKKHMDPSEREKLYLWIEGTLTEAAENR